VIAVLTPPQIRAEIVEPALQAGKHVLVEKPMALTIAECDTMVEAAARQPNVRAMAALPLRFHRIFHAAREFVAAGRLGAPSAIHTVTFGPPTELAPGRELTAWRLDRDRGGGTLVDKGIHQFDLWRFLLGREVEEISTVTRAEEEADTASVVTALLEGGAIASSIVVRSEETSSHAGLHGSKGRLDIDAHRFDGLAFQPAERFSGSPRSRLAHAGEAIRSLPQGIRSLRRGGEFRLCYEREWQHFLACIRGDASLESTLHDGREATRLTLAAIESAELGATVRLAGDAATAR
jgi:UDP-N-acetylglucosamine 3-dehydrogenase